MHVNFIFFYFLFSTILLFACKKFNILLDKKSEHHKKFTSSKKSHLIGGIFFVIFLNYYYLSVEKNMVLCLFYNFIFLLGLLSDLKKFNSVSLRFFIQLVVIVYFVNYLNFEITSTKVALFDELLKNSLVNIFFVTFCLLVLINGSNFIDGINCNTTGYFLIVLLVLFFKFDDFNLNNEILLNLVIILSTILLLNVFGIIYLGDSGSYSLSLFFGIFLINFSEANNAISPYFIILLLWYPCFELLFSMIRRSFKFIKTYEPDTYHLHHLIYRKFKINSDIKNNLILHLLTSSTINLYNCICFFISVKYIYNSEILILIFIINITLYVALYYFLKK